MEAAIMEAPQVLGEPCKLLTAEEFYATCELDRAELVNGKVIEKMPPNFEHGENAGNIYAALRLYVRARGLGRVSVEGGFRLSRNPDVVRSPDVSFVRAERIENVSRRTFIEGAPDIAVEVVSPGDRATEVEEKVQEYLGAGTLAVWVVYPSARSITVRTPDEARVYQHDQVLGGEPVLPGFEIALSEIFE